MVLNVTIRCSKSDAASLNLKVLGSSRRVIKKLWVHLWRNLWCVECGALVREGSVSYPVVPSVELRVVHSCVMCFLQIMMSTHPSHVKVLKFYLGIWRASSRESWCVSPLSPITDSELLFKSFMHTFTLFRAFNMLFVRLNLYACGLLQYSWLKLLENKPEIHVGINKEMERIAF